MRTKAEGVVAADAAIQSYMAQLDALRGEREAIAGSQRVAIETDLAHVRVEIAQALLPDAKPATLEKLDAAGDDLGLVARRAQFESQREGWETRLVEVEADPDYVNREALLAEGGDVDAAMQAAQTAVNDSLEARARFEIEPILWIEARAEAQAEQQSGFAGFWRAVTFAGPREAMARRRACRALDYDDWDSLHAELEAAKQGVLDAEAGVAHVQGRRDRISALVTEQRSLEAWTRDFEGQLLIALRQALSADIVELDLSALHAGFAGHPARPRIARALGLEKKLEYLDDMGRFLDAEIADREGRIGPIQRTRELWRRKPYENLSRDKSKWLVTVPGMKRASTDKRLRFISRMRQNVVAFDDWVLFDLLMSEAAAFVAWDAFGYGSEEAMPYDGFARSVIAELAGYRGAHGQARQDYSEFRRLSRRREDWVEGYEDDEDDYDDEDEDDYDEDDSDAEAAAAAYVVSEALDLIDAS